jgi:acetyl-CoA acetyltransferase
MGNLRERTMTSSVYVAGVGMIPFVKPGANAPYPVMGAEATGLALADAGVSYDMIQQAYVGYVYGDSTCGQRAVYTLGLTGIPVYNVNNNCSTGSTALFMAKQFVAAGIADCALALGFEKMEKGSLGVKYQDRTNPMDKQFEVMVQLRNFAPAPPAPQFFGNAGREHMERYGTTAQQFAKIGWKNHKHSVNNPYSQFQDEYSLEDVLKAPMVYEPLTKLQCCPTSDGAGAAIVVSEDFIKNARHAQQIDLSLLIHCPQLMQARHMGCAAGTEDRITGSTALRARQQDRLAAWEGLRILEQTLTLLKIELGDFFDLTTACSDSSQTAGIVWHKINPVGLCPRRAGKQIGNECGARFDRHRWPTSIGCPGRHHWITEFGSCECE